MPFRISLPGVRTLDKIKAVDMVAAPRHDHFIWSRVADFAGSDVTTVMSAHAALIIRCKALDTTCGRIHGIIFVHADRRDSTGWLAGFIPQVTAKEAAVMKKLYTRTLSATIALCSSDLLVAQNIGGRTP
jgi:hypothetical protein